MTGATGEVEPDVVQAEEEIARAWQTLLDGCGRYGAAVERIRAIIIGTPGLTGQHLGHDPRPDEWAKQARDVLDGGIQRPGLTALASLG